jgi:hypothetical protein
LKGGAVTDAENRSKAISEFNRAQDLFHSVRNAEQNSQMLQAALTSRHYWRLVGGEQEFAISDWLMSRIYVEFKEPRLAVEFAISSLSHKQDGFPYWQKASLFEGLARAYKCADKLSEFEHYKKLALETLTLETDAEDAKYIKEQISELD